MTITRALTVGLALTAALLLTACGEDEDETGEATGVAAPAAAGVAAIESIGGTDVLVDSDGRALYSAEQEAGGEILCTGACTSIWDPVLASAEEATATDVDAQLDVVERPDGDEQLALDGRPLYTFTEEGPGQLTGDGFVDEFEGTEFEWMAATVGGDSASSPPDDGSSSVPGY